jgi:hypothetical protein
MINYNDNPILVDVNSRKRNSHQKIFCVLCNNEKIQLDLVNEDENRYRCPRCKNFYQVGFEILPSEDELMSSHEEEDSVGLLVAEEDEFKSEDNHDTSKSDIKIPKYMQDSETTTVTYFREE